MKLKNALVYQHLQIKPATSTEQMQKGHKKLLKEDITKTYKIALQTQKKQLSWKQKIPPKKTKKKKKKKKKTQLQIDYLASYTSYLTLLGHKGNFSFKPICFFKNP